jgi:hypothetical protein
MHNSARERCFYGWAQKWVASTHVQVASAYKFDDMSTRPQRIRKQVIYQPEVFAQKLVDGGYANFNAFEGTESDGKEECTVTLWYRARSSNGTFSPVDGSTGKNHGHAEMDALDTFLRLLDSNRCDFDDFELYLQCEDKPCCGRCASILGFLGISPWNGNTKKTKTSMGSTEWGVSLRVGKLLEDKGVDYNVIKSLGSVVPK